MVEYITIKNKKYPIRISYSTLLVLQKKAKGTANIDKLMDEDISVLEEVLFMGLQSGAYAMDEPFTFKREEMLMLLDDCFQELIKVLPMFFDKLNPNNEGEKKDTNFQKQVKQMKKARK